MTKLEMYTSNFGGCWRYNWGQGPSVTTRGARFEVPSSARSLTAELLVDSLKYSKKGDRRAKYDLEARFIIDRVYAGKKKKGIEKLNVIHQFDWLPVGRLFDEPVKKSRREKIARMMSLHTLAMKEAIADQKAMKIADLLIENIVTGISMEYGMLTNSSNARMDIATRSDLALYDNYWISMIVITAFDEAVKTGGTREMIYSGVPSAILPPGARPVY